VLRQAIHDDFPEEYKTLWSFQTFLTSPLQQHRLNHVYLTNERLDWTKKWHHQAPKLDVRQHILNHLHQSYPCDSQPTGSRHGPLCLSPWVQIRWSLVLFITLSLRLSSLPLSTYSPVWACCLSAADQWLFSEEVRVRKSQSRDCVLHLNGCKLPLFPPRDCHFPCNGVWWGRLWFCCQGCQG